MGESMGSNNYAEVITDPIKAREVLSQLESSRVIAVIRSVTDIQFILHLSIRRVGVCSRT